MSTFQFDGRPIKAEPGDTVGSALYRSGRRVFTRSFKYHRPRGLLCAAGRCPNCLVNVDGVPNVRACTVAAREGMVVKHQNAWPSLENDVLSASQHFDFMMPAGWYYKVFRSHKLWHMVEPQIRAVAGLGEPPAVTDTAGEYEHAWWHSEVAVVGGGSSGMTAALEHAARGASVVLMDDQPELGGRARYQQGAEDAAGLRARVSAEARIRLLTGSYCFGLFEGNMLGVLQPHPHGTVKERLIHLRAGHVIVATGAYETPFVFDNNDLPGVMLSTAAQRLIRLHGIKPGETAVVAGAGPRAENVAADLKSAGVKVAAIVDPKTIRAATGSQALTSVKTNTGRIPCDLLVLCGPLVPDSGLLAQAGAKLAWNEACGAFLAQDLPPTVSAAGSVAGTSLTVSGASRPEASKRSFVCVCNDVTTSDLHDGIKEGFDHIETLKRYTTTTMGPCQGKMCQLAAIRICAELTGRSMGNTGVTTSRPPNPSVSLGALAGPRHHPIRRTPMHGEHEAAGAVWLDMGDWKRPRYYRSGPADETACVRAEYKAVRERVGLIDVSTLGKLTLQGADAGKLLDKVYTHRFSDLKTGRVRYAVICDDSGVILDDGTIARLADDRYFLSTTTGNIEFVDQWLRWWLAGTGWDAWLTNITSGLAAVNLAGPKARETLRKLTDCDLSRESFPYMACRETTVAGVKAFLMRIGFVGEAGWEIHYPAEEGPNLWRALLEAGAEFDIRPFGIEAQRLLRLEKKHVIVGVDTDALTTPFDADMAWVARLDKPDFIGRDALTRASRTPVRESLVGFEMSGDALPDDGAPIVVDGRPVGRVTSARYSPFRQCAIGMAWVPADHAADGRELDVRIAGRLVKASVRQAAFYDPEGERLRQ
ncbi:MAG TPA: 2Fe-2S iron-sulfur cluster-binding protein [Bryobacteraceae bacterium]|nr:2Fe-2S iron-sulfur cluster-binding protein [Bryobacteraceae bacterium]